MYSLATQTRWPVYIRIMIIKIMKTCTWIIHLIFSLTYNLKIYFKQIPTDYKNQCNCSNIQTGWNDPQPKPLVDEMTHQNRQNQLTPKLGWNDPDSNLQV